VGAVFMALQAFLRSWGRRERLARVWRRRLLMSGAAFMEKQQAIALRDLFPCPLAPTAAGQTVCPAPVFTPTRSAHERRSSGYGFTLDTHDCQHRRAQLRQHFRSLTPMGSPPARRVAVGRNPVKAACRPHQMAVGRTRERRDGRPSGRPCCQPMPRQCQWGRRMTLSATAARPTGGRAAQRGRWVPHNGPAR